MAPTTSGSLGYAKFKETVLQLGLGPVHDWAPLLEAVDRENVSP